MIEVKSRFNGWKVINISTALDLSRHLMNGITTMEDDIERLNYINTKFKGIQFTLKQIKERVKND
jgi:hypothetical protein